MRSLKFYSSTGKSKQRTLSCDSHVTGKSLPPVQLPNKIQVSLISSDVMITSSSKPRVRSTILEWCGDRDTSHPTLLLEWPLHSILKKLPGLSNSSERERIHFRENIFMYCYPDTMQCSKKKPWIKDPLNNVPHVSI